MAKRADIDIRFNHNDGWRVVADSSHEFEDVQISETTEVESIAAHRRKALK